MFVTAESRDDGLGISRCIHLSQEPVEHVLVLGIGPVVVTDLFCHCLRSVVDFPRRSLGVISLSQQNHRMTALVLAGRYTQVWRWQNKSLCLVSALQW